MEWSVAFALFWAVGALGGPTTPDKNDWWTNTTFYWLQIGYIKDSSNDGRGDIVGKHSGRY